MRNLTQIPIGETTSLLNIEDRLMASKLYTMGMLPNTKVEVIRKTYNNSTYYIKVNKNQIIIIRKNEAEKIFVKE